MKTKDKGYPETLTVTDQAFNRLTFVRKGDEKSPKATQWIYDGRGYKFVHYPQTGDVSPRTEERQNFDAQILFGAYDDCESRFFAFYSADCFDPPVYLVNGRSFEDAYESFTDEFIDAIKVDNWQHELQLEAMEIAHKAGQADDWRNAKDFATAWEAMLNRDEWLARAENAMTESGSVSYNPSGVPYWSEQIQGFELMLIRAERV